MAFVPEVPVLTEQLGQGFALTNLPLIFQQVHAPVADITKWLIAIPKWTSDSSKMRKRKHSSAKQRKRPLRDAWLSLQHGRSIWECSDVEGDGAAAF